MKIVVGLGNPGDQYAKTRHNIGWMVLDRIADRAGWAGKGRTRDAAAIAMGRYRGLDLTIVKPLTFMNESGLAVRKVLAREHAPLVDLLVVADDFALPFGKLRFREGGGPGGHNGLGSIIDELSTEKFSRLRIGIGAPGRGFVDHVLTPFAPDERQRLDELLDAGADAVEEWVRHGTSKAANRFNMLRAAAGRHGAARPARRRRRAARRRRHPADEDRLAQGQAGRGRGMTAPPVRGRRGRDRHLAEAAAAAKRPRGRGQGARDAGRGAGRRLPDLSALPPLLAATGSFAALRERVGAPGRHAGLTAVPHGAKTYLAAALALVEGGERLAWIARDAEIGDRVAEELQAWLGDPDAVAVLEPRTALAYERSELVADETAARVAALSAWRSGRARILVASVQALVQHTIAPDDLPATPRELVVNGRLRQDELLRDLLDLGYAPAAEVAGRGEFARRGGIVDVFPPSAALPGPDRVLRRRDRLPPGLRPDRPAGRRAAGARDPAPRVGIPSAARVASLSRAARSQGGEAAGAPRRGPRAVRGERDVAGAERRRRGGGLGAAPRAGERPRPRRRPTPSSSSTSPATSPRRPISSGARPTSGAPS